MLEDCNTWSDEQIREAEYRSKQPTDDMISFLNRVLNRKPNGLRVIPGSLKRINTNEMQYRASHTFWEVYKTECRILAQVEWGKVWHERYRLTAIEQAIIAENLINDLMLGCDKPWHLPAAYIIEGQNIVLIRSERVEEYLKTHLVAATYQDGALCYREGDIIEPIINKIKTIKK